MPLKTIQNLQVETIQLANGMTLYYKHMAEAPRTALSLYVNGGNRIESHPGLCDMIDDLLMEGTSKRSAEQIALALDGLSLDLDTDTRRDYSMIGGTFLEEDMDESLELIADLLLNSTLSEFEKEKIRLQGELIMDMDAPKSRSHDLMMTALFKDSPYQASHSRILEALPNLTSPQPLKEHYENVYQPQNMHLAVVGNCNLNNLKSKLEKYFVRGKGKSYAEESKPASALVIPQNQYITDSKDDSNQLHIYKAWFAPLATHPDYAPMVVLNCILGGAGLTSRLFLELRDKQGLAYNVRSQYETSRYVGLFYLYIGTEPSNREKALKGFEVECQKLTDIMVSEKELAEAKENVLGRRVVFLETAGQQCSYIGSQLAIGVTLDQIEALSSRIQAVTSEDVQRIAQTYLTKPSIISAVGPSKFL